MSPENMKPVQALFDAWNTGDMDALRALFDPGVIARFVPDWPEPGPHVGREAVMRQFEYQREAFDADDVKLLHHSVDVGDRVAARFIWRGAGHGPEANMEFTGVYTVRMGRIFYLEYFWDHAQALQTLGLSE